MPFGVLSGVGLGMDVLDGDGDCRRGRGSFGSEFGHPIVTKGAFVTCSSQITFRTCFVLVLVWLIFLSRSIHGGTGNTFKASFHNAPALCCR